VTMTASSPSYRGCTAELARIIDGDLERPVPTCPGVDVPPARPPTSGAATGWAAQIVATRATAPVSTREGTERAAA